MDTMLFLTGTEDRGKFGFFTREKTDALAYFRAATIDSSSTIGSSSIIALEGCQILNFKALFSRKANIIQATLV